MAVTTIAEAKQLLYGYPLAEFVASRDELVKEIRNAGDRELAAEIKKLRKPSVVAGEVNRVVRADPDRLSSVFEHLIQNAQEATPDDGQVLVRTDRRDDTILVEIKDTG